MNTGIPVWAIYTILGAYATIIILAGTVFSRKKSEETKEDYLVAERKLSILRGAASTAVSWIWAPAIFFCAVKAYTQGIPGAFWFTVPNVLCFITFALVAREMRKQDALAVSLPDYMIRRFSGDRWAHIASLVVVTIIDVVALLFNTFIGSFLLNLLAGIPVPQGILIMMGVALSYSAWRGLPASVMTDLVQLTVILVVAFIITPWAVFNAGGISTVMSGLGGESGKFYSLFNWDVFYSFGIPGSLALLSVPLADQMFYQRAMACVEKSLIKTFLLAGALFALVPLILCILGFLAASPEMKPIIEATNPPTILINVAVVQHYLPLWALVGFIFMAICALSSTLDSALCALGSLWGQDYYGRYINPKAKDQTSLKSMRIAVIIIGIAVMLLAILLRDSLSGDVLFNFNGVVALSVVPPTILAVFWKKTTAAGVTIGTAVALLLGAPFGWWANVGYHVKQNPEMVHYVVLASILTPIISFLITVIVSLGQARKKKFQN